MRREKERERGSGEIFSDISTPIFVDNLPFQIRKIWVYNLFSKFGKIKSILIPNKRSRITGQSFAFVRFFRSVDAEAAISKTNNSWVWNQKLVVKFPRFLREEDAQAIHRSSFRSQSINPVSWSQNAHYNPGMPLHHKSNHRVQNPQFEPVRAKMLQQQSKLHAKIGQQNQQNYTKEKRGKEVWRRKGIVESSTQGELRIVNPTESRTDVHMGTINIQAVGSGRLLRSAVAKMRKLVPAENLEHVFKEEGNIKVQIKAIGGRFVIITFSDLACRDSIIKEKWVSNWFEEIKPWKGEQALEERFVWLACFGMPLNAWSYSTFKEIGEKWGQFLKTDEDTLNESSYVKARILIATNQIHKLEGYVDLIVDGVKYSVRVIEEDSFRFITNSLIASPLESTMGKKKDSVEEEDDREMHKDEVENLAEVGSNYGVQEDPVTDDVENSNKVVGVPITSNEAGSSSLGLETSLLGNEMVADSFEEPSKGSQSHVEILNKKMGVLSSSLGTEKCLLENEMVADSFEKPSEGSQSQVNKPNGLLNQDSELKTDTGIEEAVFDIVGQDMECYQDEHDCNINDEHLDHFDANQIPIKATINSLKGKRQRKSINEILGYSRVNTSQSKGKRNKKVVFRAAVASAALSASISSGEINNRNRILLDEAQAIWAVDKLFGINYDGDEDEVISKIAEMEALNRERAANNH